MAKIKKSNAPKIIKIKLSIAVFNFKDAAKQFQQIFFKVALYRMHIIYRQLLKAIMNFEVDKYSIIYQNTARSLTSQIKSSNQNSIEEKQKIYLEQLGKYNFLNNNNQTMRTKQLPNKQTLKKYSLNQNRKFGYDNQKIEMFKKIKILIIFSNHIHAQTRYKLQIINFQLNNTFFYFNNFSSFIRYYFIQIILLKILKFMITRPYNAHLIQKMLEDPNQSSQSDPYTHKISQREYQTIQPILMQIDIGDGRSQTIQIQETDDPKDLAERFCIDHKLDMSIIPILAKNIRSLMDSSFGYPETFKKQYANNSNLPTEKSQANQIQSHFKRSSITINKENKINSDSPTVFDRLYFKSKTKGNQESNKNESNVTKKNKSSHKISPFINNGVLIYERNKRLSQQNKKKMIQKIQETKYLEQSKLTFQPEINEISKLMMEKMRQMSPEQTIQQKNARLKQQKIIELRRERQRQEIKQCTFRPKTNPNKSMTCKSTDRFNNLYQDYLDRARKQDKLKSEIYKQYKYQPQINSVSDIITKGMKFDDRLKKYEHEKNIKEDKLKRQRDQKQIIETETGQLLFQPKVGRAPQRRNEQNLPVYQHLYNTRNQKSILRNKQNDQNNSIMTVEHSSKIYESRKISSIQQIFTLLDSDSDGLISAQNIDISQIQSKVLKLISPLLKEMQQMNVQLEQDQFVQAIQRLFKVLNVQQKNSILQHNKKKKIGETLTFRPSLNGKSLEIAKSKRSRAQPGVSIYQYGEIKKMQKQMKIKQQKQKKGKQQLQECTFQPKVTSKKGKITALRN